MKRLAFAAAHHPACATLSSAMSVAAANKGMTVSSPLSIKTRPLSLTPPVSTPWVRHIHCPPSDLQANGSFEGIVDRQPNDRRRWSQRLCPSGVAMVIVTHSPGSVAGNPKRCIDVRRKTSRPKHQPIGDRQTLKGKEKERVDAVERVSNFSTCEVAVKGQCLCWVGQGRARKCCDPANLAVRFVISVCSGVLPPIRGSGVVGPFTSTIPMTRRIP